MNLGYIILSWPFGFAGLVISVIGVLDLLGVKP